MNNKKNDKKNLQNVKMFMTYLLLNKKRFLPNKQSLNLYFDHNAVSHDLKFSKRKTYNVFNACVNQKLITVVSHKYFASKFSRLFYINPFKIDDYIDTDIVTLEAARFTKIKTDDTSTESCDENRNFEKTPVNTSNYHKPDDDNILSNYFYHPFFLNLKYASTYRNSFDKIDPYFSMYVKTMLADNENKIEYKKPLYIDLVSKINSTNRSECEYVYFNEKITITKTPKKYKIKKSCRAYSQLCNSSKKYLRPEIMKLLNLPNEYDITATVPALFRLLNYNIFNPDENIRQLIIDQSNVNHIINEKQLKPFTFRLVYAKSYAQSFAQLSNAYQNKSIPNDIPNITAVRFK
jgi:hypothetical protein